MTLKHSLLCGAAAGAVLFAAQPSFAQTAALKAQIDALQQQMNAMQQQMQTLQGQLTDTQAQQQQLKAQAQPQGQGGQLAPAAPTGAMATMAGHPGICTTDGRNCLAVTGRIHFDVGDYLEVHPQSKTGPHSLTSGVNARRARIGVVGKFAQDWNYALIYDFGGTTDSGSAGINPSGIENAFLSYQGLKPAAFEIGYMDLPWTMDESMSSNDIPFLERATPGVVATNLAAGDFRSAAGVRANDDRFWVGAYVTGPQSGALHSGSNSQQLGAVERAAYQVLQGPNYSLHIGADAEQVLTPRANGGSNTSIADTLTFSDRPELRVDSTTFLTTGAIPAKGAQVYGGELGGTFGPFFFQGEFYHFMLDQAGQGAGAPRPTLEFDGGYAEAAWAITGESRPYVPTAAAYGGIRPANPVDQGGWGAWEVAARISEISLNDSVTPGRAQAATGGVFGGQQTNYTLGLNWYPVNNIRFLLDYVHSDLHKLATNGVTPAGLTIDAVALRTQVAF